MRLPRFRFTLWKVMVVVAIVAVTLAAVNEYRLLSRKAVLFRARAKEHAALERTLRWIIEKDGPDAPIDISAGPGIRSKRFNARTVAEFQAALSRKYERAARYPWLPLAPDPPEPE